MAVFTWKNVQPSSKAGLFDAMARANLQATQAQEGMFDTLSDYAVKRQEDAQNQMMAEMLQAGEDPTAQQTILDKYTQHDFAPSAEKLVSLQDQMLDRQLRRSSQELQEKQLDLATQKFAQQEAEYAANAPLREAKEGLLNGMGEDSSLFKPPPTPAEIGIGDVIALDSEAALTPEQASVRPDQIVDTPPAEWSSQLDWNKLYKQWNMSSLGEDVEAIVSNNISNAIAQDSQELLSRADLSTPEGIRKIKQQIVKYTDNIATATNRAYANQVRERLTSNIDYQVNADKDLREGQKTRATTEFDLYTQNPSTMTKEGLDNFGRIFAELGLEQSDLDVARVVETINYMGDKVDLTGLRGAQLNDRAAEVATTVMNRYPVTELASIDTAIDTVLERQGITFKAGEMKAVIKAQQETAKRDERRKYERDQKNIEKEATQAKKDEGWLVNYETAFNTRYSEDDFTRSGEWFEGEREEAKEHFLKVLSTMGTHYNTDKALNKIFQALINRSRVDKYKFGFNQLQLPVPGEEDGYKDVDEMTDAQVQQFIKDVIGKK